MLALITHHPRSPLLVICLALFGACLMLCLYQIWLAEGRQYRRMHLWIAAWCGLSSAAVFFKFIQFSAILPAEAAWSIRVYVGLYAFIPYFLMESLYAIRDNRPTWRLRIALFLAGGCVGYLSLATHLFFTDEVDQAVHVFGHVYYWARAGIGFAPVFLVIVGWSLWFSIRVVRDATGLQPIVRRLLLIVMCMYALLGIQGILAGLSIVSYSLFDLAFPLVSTGFTYIAVLRYRMLQEQLEALASTQTQELAAKNASLDIALREAQAAARAKSLFLANMSHELRTPMNGVLGMAELLHGSHLGDEERQILDAIQHSGVTLLAILNDILDLSQIEAGRMSIQKQPFSLEDVLSNSVRLLGVSAAQKGLDLHWELDDVLKKPLRGDAFRLQQVLLNLTSNAIKFTTTGEVRLSATVGEQWPYFVKAHIAVSDTGKGIASNEQESIFESFTQGDMTSTRPAGGVGLGLAISRELVKLMGGDIHLASELGQGSTFTVTLPLELARDAKLPKPSRIITQELSFLVRVLIVEDNAINQVVAQKMLKELGCASVVAEDGEKALAFFDKEHFDMILMDCLMPVMDGFAATTAIRQREASRARRIPIIAMTANALEGDRERCLAAGMDDYIAKPMTIKLLRATIVKWCQGPVGNAIQRKSLGPGKQEEEES